MTTPTLVLTSNNVQLPNHVQPIPATVHVESGKIVKIIDAKTTRNDHLDKDVQFEDFGDLYLLPGLVDAHVHLNEPGRTDWEGFYTGTRAAVAGGFTTVVDMPLNSIPPTTTVDHLQQKRDAATGQCFSDVAFWGGVIPGNQDKLLSLVEAGVKGFKCFLIESGVEEFPCVAEEDASAAMSVLRLSPSVLLFHAELDCHPSPTKGAEGHDPRNYDTFLNSRPDSLEMSAIELIIALNEKYPSLRTHIVHLSSAPAIPLVKSAKAKGLPLTVETCFHYLCLTASDIPDGHPEFKCCPPIRSGGNREELWKALLDGTIDFVVSDHSPSIAELKCLDSGDIMKAWGGIGGLGLGLSLLWTEARKRGIPMGQVVEWLSLKPARHVGLDSSKGSIEVGKDADIVVFDPSVPFEVTKESLNFKNKVSPYTGLKLTGRVKKTILRGQVAWEQGYGFAHVPFGQLL